MSRDGFRCGGWGKWHNGLPMSWAIAAPIYGNPTDGAIKTGASSLTEDLCVIQGEHFFVKGDLEIPVMDRNAVFAFSLWTSLRRENFERIKLSGTMRSVSTSHCISDGSPAACRATGRHAS